MLQSIKLQFLYIGWVRIRSHFSLLSLNRISFFSSQTLFFHSKPSTLVIFDLDQASITWYVFFILSLHSCILDLGFGFLKIFWVFEIFVKFLDWVLLIWCYLLMHCILIAFQQCFMHYRCVFDYWNVCWQVWIGFYPWCFLNIARHMFMHTYLFFSFLFFVSGCDVFSLSFSLSLSLSLSHKLCYGT